MSKLSDKKGQKGKLKTYFYWFVSAVCLLSGVDAAMQVPKVGLSLCIFPYLAGGLLFFPPYLERVNIPLWLRWVLFLALIGGFGAMSAALKLPFVPIQAMG